MIKNLKLLRTERGISQQQLANVLKISQQSINKYENHNIEPDIETLIAMADFFDVTVDYLIGRYDNPSLLNIEINDNEKQMIKDFRKLDSKEKLCVKTLIDTYKSLKTALPD